MSDYTVKSLKKKFMDFANSDEFAETLIEWHHYSGDTKQVFVRAEGRWDNEVKDKLGDYLKTIHKRLLLSRVITRKRESEDVEEYV
tara:strand:- start:76 stop:333 length:258 start_codon:yes stop_codon:yes gene_type:complete